MGPLFFEEGTEVPSGFRAEGPCRLHSGNEGASEQRFLCCERHAFFIADLPGDHILTREYPSFEDVATRLPPRGVSDLPQGSPEAPPASLGTAGVGVGALGRGGPLWNVLGSDQAAVNAAIEEEKKFVEERWLQRLAETHRLTSKQHDSVREEQAEKLKRMKQPKWAFAVDHEEVEAPAALSYDFKTYGPHFEAYIVGPRATPESYSLLPLPRSRSFLDPLPSPPPLPMIPRLPASRGGQENAILQRPHALKLSSGRLVRVLLQDETAAQVTSSELHFDLASESFEETPLLDSRERSAKSRKEKGEKEEDLERFRAASAHALAAGEVYGPSASGFRLKQISPPVAHRAGISSFFYFHAPHSAPFVPFINACRRETFGLPRPAVTALKIENLDSFVDAPPLQPPPPSQANIPDLHQHPLQQKQRQMRGLGASTFMTRLPVEFGMCVIGMREDVEDLVENLRQIIFRRKKKSRRPSKASAEEPRQGTYENPWVASLSVKGPIAAVAGDLVLPDELEVVNKSQYLCTMNANYYLNFKVKIEEIEEFVLPEFGYDSLNRDIDADGFFYFASYCCPVPVFGFDAQRVPEATISAATPEAHRRALQYYGTVSYEDAQRQRYGRDPSSDPVLTEYAQCLPSDALRGRGGGTTAEGKRPSSVPPDASCPPSKATQNTPPETPNEIQTGQERKSSGVPTSETAPPFPYESLGEIVTIEVHTDGSATPREAFLEAIERVGGLASAVGGALLKNCKISRDGSVEEEFEDPDMYQDKHRYTGVPWNPHKDSLARTLDRHKTYFRNDMLRQYSPVKEQLLRRRELFGDEKPAPEGALPARSTEKAKEGPSGPLAEQSEGPPQVADGGPPGSLSDEQERLLDEEELEDELVQRSPTLRVEREKEYQAALKLRADIEVGKKLQERGDGEGLPKFPIKHKGLEMPPDWVFEDFMAQRVPVGWVTGFTDD
ncbi:DNA-directed RNA polymerase alpha [Cyclospora cayetanensis]|uniref:DNA-directed RNA polymerase alpha n=1 Tax=Cyclospora cayetanensis TaxID=88456 RepID=A0A1D3CRU4_9EIME|nr:DNA-directed RNA polymerase alpha [Cyclospora cayetanensis]